MSDSLPGMLSTQPCRLVVLLEVAAVLASLPAAIWYGLSFCRYLDSSARPALIYATEFCEPQKVEIKEFFWVRDTPAWRYKVRFANLTERPIPNIEITTAVSEADDVWVVPENFAPYTADGTLLEKGEPVKLSTDDAGAMGTLFLRHLPSGTGLDLRIIVAADMRPSLQSIVMSIASPHGEFEKITSSEYEAVGWR
jgi:hypothetical protein